MKLVKMISLPFAWPGMLCANEKADGVVGLIMKLVSVVKNQSTCT